jgi:hypothetical protein
MEEGEEDDHEGPGSITSRRPWQPGTLMSKISRTVRGGREVARNARKGCRTLDMMIHSKLYLWIRLVKIQWEIVYIRIFIPYLYAFRSVISHC